MGKVEPNEPIARFVIDRNRKSYARGDNTVRHNAFIPAKNDGKTSIFRTQDMTEDEIWETGTNHVANPQGRNLAGRVDLDKAEPVYEQGLDFEPDNTPPRHANIINWPDDDSEKKSKAQEIAARAHYIPL